MSIKAISKKKIGLRAGDKIIVMEPLAYTVLPDEVQADPMFNWAKADGTLQVVGEEEKPAKKKAAKKPEDASDGDDKPSPSDDSPNDSRYECIRDYRQRQQYPVRRYPAIHKRRVPCHVPSVWRRR